MKNKRQYTIITINLFIFIVITILFKTNNIAAFDNKIYQLITSYKNDYLTTFFKLITFLCSPFFIATLTIILLFCLKKEKIGLKIAINVIICTILNQVLKNLFRRPRPVGISLIKENGFSFPSGHSMVSLGFYGFIIYILNNSKESKTKKTVLSILLSFLILLIGVSRIYLGVHYASDVLAAYAISLVHLTIYTKYYKKIG